MISSHELAKLLQTQTTAELVDKLHKLVDGATDDEKEWLRNEAMIVESYGNVFSTTNIWTLYLLSLENRKVSLKLLKDNAHRLEHVAYPHWHAKLQGNHKKPKALRRIALEAYREFKKL